MRILHLSQRYFPAIGGAEIELEKISDYLVAAGHAGVGYLSVGSPASLPTWAADR